MRSEQATPERWAYFLEHVMEPSEGCRLWPYATSGTGGYGRVWVPSERRVRAVHVLTATLWRGERPPGAEVAHSCGNRQCWAGEHLRWATTKENAADRLLHGTATLGVKHGRHKLTDEQVLAIRRLAGTGTHAEIAERFGVTRRTVGRILTRRIWTHLPEEK